MKTIGERLKWARKQRGVTQRQVAEMVGVTTSAIGNLESGIRDKPRELNAIARAIGARAEWLETGRGNWDSPADWPPYKDPAPREEPQPEHAGTMLRVRRVPVVGTAKMGDDGYYDEVSSIPGAGDGHIEIAVDDPNAYGIRVRGQSMFPAIRDGWYVLVKPNGTPQEGEYVLLKLADGRKMVKELLFRRAGSIEVMSVNGGERLTFELSELEGIQAIGAVVSPSQWRPD